MHVVCSSRPSHTQNPRLRLAVQRATIPTPCMSASIESKVIPIVKSKRVVKVTILLRSDWQWGGKNSNFYLLGNERKLGR